DPRRTAASRAPTTQRTAPTRSARRSCLQGRLSFSTSRAGSRPLGTPDGAVSSVVPRASVGRCATRGLRTRPPPDPSHRAVTFLNGRASDICIWWTHLDPLVRLELDEFERASTDRMTAHVARRYVAGVDRREPGSEQCDKSRLRPPQTKGDLIVAVGRDLFEVAIPCLTRIETKFVSRLAGQQVPGAFDVLGGERLAV